MIKTAIFVEGQTELIFVREFLLKMFEYQNVAIECFNLFTDSNFHPTEYAFPNDAAEYFFQIINVGNDQGVLTRMLRREKFMWDSGFNRIIGLRDMYSKQYRDEVKDHKISEEVNKKFVEGHGQQLKSKDAFFIFAIMEVEAWLLGLRDCFEKMDNRLTIEYIEQKLGFNLDKIDPETFFFHPADKVDSIFKLIGKNYNKSKGDINALASFIDKIDYKELISSTKCTSFRNFVSCLPGL
jgi:hypothetical protein